MAPRDASEGPERRPGAFPESFGPEGRTGGPERADPARSRIRLGTQGRPWPRGEAGAGARAGAGAPAPRVAEIRTEIRKMTQIMISAKFNETH